MATYAELQQSELSQHGQRTIHKKGPVEKKTCPNNFFHWRQRSLQEHFPVSYGVVENSSPVSHLNIPQLVGMADGSVLVKTFDWQKHLTPHFRRLPQIKSYQHFSFDTKRPGVVLAKTHCDAEPIEYQLLRNGADLPPVDSLPVLAPPGLTIDRQAYLYEKIRPFCADEARDITCPAPKGWRWFGGGVDLLVTGAGNRAEHTWFQSTITTTPEKAWFTSTPLPDDSVTKPRLCPCYQPAACSLQSPATAARYATWSGGSPVRFPSSNYCYGPAAPSNHLAIMDPAETDNIKRALANQGALVTKHETTLRQVVDNLQQLATGITDLGGRMDAITGQLTALAHAPPPPPAPVPPPAVAPMVAPREPFIPTPA
ncbi:hypothetical protein cypCar_00043689%2C partial, partial [Scomber scombrus]